MSENCLAYSEQESVLTQPSNATHTVSAQQNSRIVDSLLHPLAMLIRQVLSRRERRELNLILIDDEENIIQALHAGVAIHSLYYSGGEMPTNELLRKLPANVSVYEVAKRTCKKLFENDRVSRVFAIARTPATLCLDSLLENRRDIVVLEDLTISGNIGAIVRNTLAFGAGGIVLLNADPMDVYDRRLIRASRGYVFSLPIVTATTREFIDFCRQKRLSILVMAAEAEHSIEKVVCSASRLAIVFGGEKDGCSQTLKKAATLQVQIPTHSKVESLNVSTAAGIMLYNRVWFNHPQVRK